MVALAVLFSLTFHIASIVSATGMRSSFLLWSSVSLIRHMTERPALSRMPSRSHIQIGKTDEGLRLEVFSHACYSNTQPIFSYDEDALSIYLTDVGHEVSIRPLVTGYYDILINDVSQYHCYYTREAKGILLNVIAEEKQIRIAESPDSTCVQRRQTRPVRPMLPESSLKEEKDWVLL